MRIESWILIRNLEEPQCLRLPIGSQVRHIAANAGQVWIYVELDIEQEFEARFFQMCRTDYSTPANGKYIGSAIVEGTSWHVFEVYKKGRYDER